VIEADLNNLHRGDPGNENYAIIAPDARFIIFANFDIEGRGTDEDLFVSWRQGNTWSAPRALSGGVNTPGTESSPQIINNGQTLAWRFADAEGSGVRMISLSSAIPEIQERN
jgi:OmpA-OmpF porin, OOP family